MAAKKKEEPKLESTDWGEVISVGILELPPKNKQAYDVGVYCTLCGASILTAVMKYDGQINVQVPETCPMCDGKGEDFDQG